MTCLTVLMIGCLNFHDTICRVAANQFSRMYSMLYSDKSAQYVPDTRLKCDMVVLQSCVRTNQYACVNFFASSEATPVL